MMNDNRQEGVIELLTNEDFKKWVLEPTYERDLYWRKWIEHNPGRKQQVKVASEFVRAARFPRPAVSEDEKDKALSFIISQTEYKPEASKFHNQPRQKKTILWPYLLKTAAVFLAILMVGGLFWDKTKSKEVEEVKVKELTIVKKENPAGRKSIIVLPDGTKAYLNSASTLTYNSDFGKQDRTVSIEGEAFFEVKPDSSKPFNVVSGEVMTTALGTSFNVRAFENDHAFKVALRTGKVRVVNLSPDSTIDQEHILVPGEGYIIEKENLAFKKVSVDPVLEYGWTEGILSFDGNNLGEVKEALERWYGVKIKITGKPKNKWRVYGRFQKETLEQVLEGLSFTYNLEFLIKGKDVELKF